MRVIVPLDLLVREIEANADGSNKRRTVRICLNKHNIKVQFRLKFDSEAEKYGLFKHEGLRFISEFEKLQILTLISGLVNPAVPVLDVGCGWGRYLSVVSSDLMNPVGVDLSKQMLRTGRSKFSQLDLIQADMAHLPLKDSVFSLVYSVRAFKYSPDPQLALKEICRICKKDGFVLLYEVNNALSFAYLGARFYLMGRFFNLFSILQRGAWTTNPFRMKRLLEIVGFNKVSYKGLIFIPDRLYIFTETRLLLNALAALERVTRMIWPFGVFAYGVLYLGTKA